ncbi:MAG: DUF882 domain-containing protein [Pseudomonadales bacterium]
MGRRTPAVFLAIALAGCAAAPPQTTPVVHTPPPITVTPVPPVMIPLPLAPDAPQAPGQPYYDPNATGVPLFDTRGEGGRQLGRYFSIDDFARTGVTHFRFARIDERLVKCLDRVRESTGEAIEVLSAYRSFEYNESIRRRGESAASRSFHTSGSAADVRTATPVQQFAVAVYLECGCFTGLGIAPTFYHVDIRPSLVPPWGYSRTNSGRLAAARNVQRRMCGG